MNRYTTPSLHVLIDELEFMTSDGKVTYVEPGTDIVLWQIVGTKAYLCTQHVHDIGLHVDDLDRFLESESED